MHYAAFYMDKCQISNRKDDNFEDLVDPSFEYQNHMSDEAYEMLEDEEENRISTSLVSDQKYNVFVLRRSWNVWILGYNERSQSDEDSGI